MAKSNTGLSDRLALGLKDFLGARETLVGDPPLLNENYRVSHKRSVSRCHYIYHSFSPMWWPSESWKCFCYIKRSKQTNEKSHTGKSRWGPMWHSDKQTFFLNSILISNDFQCHSQCWRWKVIIRIVSNSSFHDRWRSNEYESPEFSLFQSIQVFLNRLINFQRHFIKNCMNVKKLSKIYEVDW